MWFAVPECGWMWMLGAACSAHFPSMSLCDFHSLHCSLGTQARMKQRDRFHADVQTKGGHCVKWLACVCSSLGTWAYGVTSLEFVMSPMCIMSMWSPVDAYHVEKNDNKMLSTSKYPGVSLQPASNIYAFLSLWGSGCFRLVCSLTPWPTRFHKILTSQVRRKYGRSL